MQAIQGIYNDGKISLDTSAPTNRATVIVIFPDEHNADEGRETANPQKVALARFRKAIQSSPPLPPEFDDVMSQRVNIERRLDL